MAATATGADAGTFDGTAGVTRRFLQMTGGCNPVLIPDRSIANGTSATAAASAVTTGTGGETVSASAVGGNLSYNQLDTFAGVGTYASGTSLMMTSGSAANTISAKMAIGSSQTWKNNSTNALSTTGDLALGVNTLTLAGGFGQSSPANRAMWSGQLAFAAAHNDLAVFEAIAGVPEPTSVSLMAIGGAAVLRRRGWGT